MNNKHILLIHIIIWIIPILLTYNILHRDYCTSELLSEWVLGICWRPTKKAYVLWKNPRENPAVAEAWWNQIPNFETFFFYQCMVMPFGHTKMIRSHFPHIVEWCLEWGYKKIWNFPEVLDFRRRCRSKTWRLTSAPSRRCCLGFARVTLKLGLCRFHSGDVATEKQRSDLGSDLECGNWTTRSQKILGWCMNLCTITKKNHIEYLYRVYWLFQGSEVVIILLEMACLVGWDLADVFCIFVNLHEDQRGGRNPSQGITISRIFSGLGSFYLLAVANEKYHFAKLHHVETLREISGSCEVAVYVNLHEGSKSTYEK